MKTIGMKRLCTLLLAVCLVCVLAMPLFAEEGEDPNAQQQDIVQITQTTAPVPAAPTGQGPTDTWVGVTGEVYYGTDYLQFHLGGPSSDTNTYYCDLSYFDFTTTQDVYVARDVPCGLGTPMGFDVATPGQVYTLTLRNEKGTVLGLAKSFVIYAQLQVDETDPTKVKTVPIALAAVGCDQSGKLAQDLSMDIPPTYYDKDAQQDYDLVNGSSTIHFSQNVNQDVYSQTFDYKKHVPAAINGTVYYVDEHGQTIEFKDKTTGDVKKHETVSIPAAANVDQELKDLSGLSEKTGTLSLTAADGTEYYVANPLLTKLKFNYYGSTQHVVQCKLADPTKATTYRANIAFVDTAGNVLRTDSMIVKTDGQIYNAPMTFRRDVNGKAEYYATTEAQAKQVFSLPAKLDDLTKAREITYTKFDGTTPYNWSIRLIDAQTGTLLNYSTQVILPENGAAKPVTFTPLQSFQHGSVTYTLDAAHMESGAPKQYTHTYAVDDRVLSIYYLPQGYTRPAAYDIAVRYINIANGSVLNETKVQATPTQPAIIDCPTGYDKDGVSYVRLAGQPDSYTHNYNNSTRLTYSVYYRDKNAPQYENTVIYTTEVIDAPDLGATIIGRGTTGAGPAGTEVIAGAVNEETGEDTAFTEDGTETGQAREEIADDQAPLAAPEQGQAKEESAFDWKKYGVSVGIIVVSSAVLATCLVVLLRKKRGRRRG